MKQVAQIGFGGSCHWCTEAVFQSLTGVVNVEQGYIASSGKNTAFSEGIVVFFNAKEIALFDLISVHIYTHQSTSIHSFRSKYRSAVYYTSDEQNTISEAALTTLQKEFSKKIITEVIALKKFKPSREELKNYYQKGPNKPFCQRYIHPKLELIRKKYAGLISER